MIVARAPSTLRLFNEAGVLNVADVHVAVRLCDLAEVTDEDVLLAVALAVRAPRLGHVFVDLATIAETAAVDAEEPVDVSELPWPEPVAWVSAVGASPLSTPPPAPLRLVGTWLYLDRYWREEQQVAADLKALAVPADVDLDQLASGLATLFEADRGSRQALAAATAVLRRFAVIAGGPGTGKTTTVSFVLDLLGEDTLVALAAPTAVAAARLEAVTKRPASTIHRLLGWQGPGRFRHNRLNRLPHDVVILDEASMVSLSLMADLVAAVRPDARLVLVGDPGQLRSIEAGAVLGDIVGPAADGPVFSDEFRATLESVTGSLVAAAPGGGPVSDGIVVLDRVRRFGERIGALAQAIRRGDADAVVEALDAPEEITWVASDPAEADVGVVREAAVSAGRAVFEAAWAGDASAALTALGSFRVLCAHRRGPHGVSHWTAQIESWLTAAIPGFVTDGRFYVGQPLLVTENDYELRLFNGDTGVVISVDGQLVAAFARGNEVITYSPTRLETVETVYAMTIHKAQGSQFRTAAVLLPPPDSRLLTRELLYTAATRAEERLLLVGSEGSVRAGVELVLPRASGLTDALW